MKEIKLLEKYVDTSFSNNFYLNKTIRLILSRIVFFKPFQEQFSSYH